MGLQPACFVLQPPCSQPPSFVLTSCFATSSPHLPDTHQLHRVGCHLAPLKVGELDPISHGS